MYEIHFYKDVKGQEPVKKFLLKLEKKNDKDSRVNLTKIRDYLRALSIHGTQAGEPYVKHLDGKIWELRPLRNRILFFGTDGDRLVLLSHFVKKTRKTPRKEIEKAQRLMRDYLERSNQHENDD